LRTKSRRAVAYLLNVIPGLDISLKEDDSLLGLAESLNLVSYNKGNLWDVVDTMA
jgi:hypothetical protein